MSQLGAGIDQEAAGLTDLQTSVNGLVSGIKAKLPELQTSIASIVKFAESAKAYAAKTGEFAGKVITYVTSVGEIKKNSRYIKQSGKSVFHRWFRRWNIPD